MTMYKEMSDQKALGLWNPVLSEEFFIHPRVDPYVCKRPASIIPGQPWREDISTRSAATGMSIAKSKYRSVRIQTTPFNTFVLFHDFATHRIRWVSGPFFNSRSRRYDKNTLRRTLAIIIVIIRLAGLPENNPTSQSLGRKILRILR